MAARVHPSGRGFQQQHSFLINIFLKVKDTQLWTRKHSERSWLIMWQSEVTLLSWIHHQPAHISGHITDRWLECSVCRTEPPLKCSSCDIPSVLCVPLGLTQCLPRLPKTCKLWIGKSWCFSFYIKLFFHKSTLCTKLIVLFGGCTMLSLCFEEKYSWWNLNLCKNIYARL